MRRVSIVFLLFAFCFTGHPDDILENIFDDAFTETETHQMPILVNVQVWGSENPENQDIITQKLLQTYIKSGLRGLGKNIKFVDHIASSYQIRIIVLEPEYKSGVKKGDIAISYVLTKLPKLGHGSCDCYLYSNLLIYPRTELREACDLIVGTIDDRIVGFGK